MPRNTAVKKSHGKIIAKKQMPKAKSKGTGRNGMKLPRSLRHSHIYQTSRKLKASEVPEGTLTAKIGDLKKEWISVADTHGKLAWRLKTDRLMEKLCTPPKPKKAPVVAEACNNEFVCGTEEPEEGQPTQVEGGEVVVEPAHEVVVVATETETEAVVEPATQDQ